MGLIERDVRYLQNLSDEELRQKDPATGKVHGTANRYKDCTIGPDGSKCDRCYEAKRRNNKRDQDRLRAIDPNYFKHQARRLADRRRVARGEEPWWDETGEFPVSQEARRYSELPLYQRLYKPPDPGEPGYVELPPHIRHGSDHAYGYYRCRCKACKRSRADRQNAYQTRKRGHLLAGEAKGWDELPVGHLKDLRKGEPVKPLSSHNQHAVVKVEEPSKGRKRDREVS